MGAPVGNQNAVKTKRFSQAIERVLLADDGKKLRALAEKLVSMGLKGEIQAIREVADRFEGKVPQGVEMSGANGGEIVIRDAATSVGVARRIAYALAQGAIAKAALSSGEQPKQATKSEG